MIKGFLTLVTTEFTFNFPMNSIYMSTKIFTTNKNFSTSCTFVFLYVFMDLFYMFLYPHCQILFTFFRATSAASMASKMILFFFHFLNLEIGFLGASDAICDCFCCSTGRPSQRIASKVAIASKYGQIWSNYAKFNKI